jgi:hypothetical protein
MSVGNRWKNKSNMSMGLVNVPCFSMINFSMTWGIGLKGARSIKTAKMISIVYGILSRKANEKPPYPAVPIPYPVWLGYSLTFR